MVQVSFILGLPIFNVQWCGQRIACGVVLVVLMAWGVAKAEVGPDATVTRSFSIPLSSGEVNLGDVLAKVLDGCGMDGSAVRGKLNFKIDARGKLGAAQLDQIAGATRGVVKLELTESDLIVHVDRLALRRHEKGLRSQLRDLLSKMFPEYAAAADRQYGLFTVDDSGTLAALDTFRAPAGDATRTVVLVHGLDEPGDIWDALIPALGQAGHRVVVFNFPNDQAVDRSASMFHAKLKQLRQRGVKKISIVGHSMGGLVSREMLTNAKWYGGKGSGQRIVPEVDRLIMVGTPNHGSAMAPLRFASEIRDHIARTLSGDGVLFGDTFDGAGEAQVDLEPESEFLLTLNARPHPTDVKYTIIAGVVSPVSDERIASLKGSLPESMAGSVNDLVVRLKDLSRGFGDGCVSLQSTRLDGVDDFVTVEANHITMLCNVVSDEGVPPAIPVILERLSQ